MHCFLYTATLASLALSVLGVAIPQELSPCLPMETGSGDVANPDTPDAFLAYQPFANAANAANEPSGYTMMYKNQQFTYNQYDRFLGYANMASYDVQACADQCSATRNCGGFTIHYERGPTLNPGPGCANPASTTIIKCNFWNDMGLAFDVINPGQWRGQFRVVIAGSNAYHIK